jgi:hypothetical protein
MLIVKITDDSNKVSVRDQSENSETDRSHDPADVLARADKVIK